MQEAYSYEPHLKRRSCAFYEIENLVNWWLPELCDQVWEIGKVVSFFENLGGYEGAKEYQFEGNMEQLGSDLQKQHKIFKRNYDAIWNKIREEAKKTMTSRDHQPKGQLVAQTHNLLYQSLENSRGVPLAPLDSSSGDKSAAQI